MQLIIKDDFIVAIHEDYQNIVHLYPGYECVSWHEPLPHQGPEDPPLRDPRSDEEKQQAYKDKRRTAYPPVVEQLDMLYHDRIDGTDTWRDAIEAVKLRFPKPVEE